MEEIVVNSGAPLQASAGPTARRQLDRQQWIESAVDVLAEQGLSGLRVEVLAKTCGVTKGSFYWHFRDRTDLFEAVLKHWRDGRLRDIEKMTSAPAGQAQTQLERVFDVYGASRNRKGIAIELAVRDWAKRDPMAADVVASVDQYRLECTRRLYVATGMTDEEARSRSVLLYACVFGLSLMNFDGFGASTSKIRHRVLQP